MAYYAPFYQPSYYSPTNQRNDMNGYNQQFQQTFQQPSFAQQQAGNGLIWVQGEAGAKSYLVAPNTTVMLMDSEGDRFYLKSADASGMPLPLRIFDYKERAILAAAEPKAPTRDFSEMGNIFVTREEFERRIASIGSGCKCKEHEKNKLTEDAENGEQSV